ncbi:hypothetical protein AJ80_03026 [Polytolypa hystricis UAMH7299]|uniref:Uncharacterized protein n=1 Tax=Polytolypa hystricis (strain UAMH7299) TaxID=1447883 RepID=A0A2B7YKQ0_POLH7|nr:hypothetical protein AJ80_03026 [Polytolypa hystricis UAMH7299]
MDTGLLPLCIFTCNICWKPVDEIYANSLEVHGLHDENQPRSDAVPAKVWFFPDCTHILCSEHLPGGGVPFYPAGSQPLAECPICNEHHEKPLAKLTLPIHLPWINGCDQAPHSKFFQAPKIDCAEDEGIHIMKFQYESLMRFAGYTARESEQREQERLKDKERLNGQMESMMHKVDKLGAELVASRKRVRELELWGQGLSEKTQDIVATFRYGTSSVFSLVRHPTKGNRRHSLELQRNATREQPKTENRAEARSLRHSTDLPYNSVTTFQETLTNRSNSRVTEHRDLARELYNSFRGFSDIALHANIPQARPSITFSNPAIHRNDGAWHGPFHTGTHQNAWEPSSSSRSYDSRLEVPFAFRCGIDNSAWQDRIDRKKHTLSPLNGPTASKPRLEQEAYISKQPAFICDSRITSRSSPHKAFARPSLPHAQSPGIYGRMGISNSDLIM